MSQEAVHASLILATYEMPRHLELVCAALERQTFKNFEILICDDGSGTETREVIERFSQTGGRPVTHLWQENKGFRKARILNEAIRKSKGSLLIFLDGDCVPHRKFIEDHCTQYQQGTFQCGRRVELGPKLSAMITADDVRSGFLDFPRWPLVRSVLEGDSQHLQRSFRIAPRWLRKILKMNHVDDLKGCNYSVARSDMFEINGYDETFEGYGREDTDIEIRLLNLGLKRTSLKGLALQFHVWHPRREFTPANDDRLRDSQRLSRIRCERGLSTLETNSLL